MNIQVLGAQVNFVNGKLVLGYFDVNVSAGTYPNSFSGSLQITEKQGVTLTTPQDEIEAVARQVIKDMVNKDNTVTTTEVAQ